MYNVDDLIDLGRDMLDRSERMNTGNEKSSGRANNLSRIGDLLIRIGTPFGTRLDKLSDSDGRFILSELHKFKGKKNKAKG